MYEAFILLWLLTLHPQICLLSGEIASCPIAKAVSHTPIRTHAHAHKHGNWSQRWQQYSIVALSQGNIFDVRVLGNAASLSSVLQTNFVFFLLFFFNSFFPPLSLSLCTLLLFSHSYSFKVEIHRGWLTA